MKLLPLFVLFLSFGSQPLAADSKEACPKILESAGLISKATASALKEQYATMNAEGRIEFRSQDGIDTFVIKEGKDSTRFKITVEELKTGATDSKKLSLDCPVIRSWEAMELPNLAVNRPETVVDQIDKETPGAQLKVIRGGVELVKIFAGKDDFLTTTLYWRLSTKEGQVSWPKLITDSNTTFSRNSLTEGKTLPVRGVRISTTENFGNIWYLVSKKTQDRILDGKREFLKADPDGYATTDTRLALSKSTARLDDLEFYDSKNRNFIPCEQALNPFSENSCFNFNYQLNPTLWDSMKKGLPFFVQILVELEKGFLVQTYKVGEGENSDPVLVRQVFEADLNKYNISPNFFKN